MIFEYQYSSSFWRNIGSIIALFVSYVRWYISYIGQWSERPRWRHWYGKYFPSYWPFVRGIRLVKGIQRWSPLTTGLVMRSFDDFFVVSSNHLTEQTDESSVIGDAMTLMWRHPNCRIMNRRIWPLTHKRLETHLRVFSTVATDAPVLKHQAISIHDAD